MILPVFLLIGILIRIDRIRPACERFCHAEQRVFPIPPHVGQAVTVIFLCRDVRPAVVCSSTIQPGLDPCLEILQFGQST